MQIESPKTITIDNVEHEVSKFGPKVQQLVAIHTRWRGELVDAKLEVAKLESAIKTAEAEMVQSVNADIVLMTEASAAQDAANDEEVVSDKLDDSSAGDKDLH